MLTFWDYAIIALIVMLFAGGGVAYSASRPARSGRLARVERKLDALLQHLNVAYTDPVSPEGLSPEFQKLLDDGSNKIPAIRLHREQTGVGLKEAKDAVEAYLRRG